jgi:hypothetical protein
MMTTGDRPIDVNFPEGRLFFDIDGKRPHGSHKPLKAGVPQMTIIESTRLVAV